MQRVERDSLNLSTRRDCGVLGGEMGEKNAWVLDNEK